MDMDRYNNAIDEATGREEMVGWIWDAIPNWEWDAHDPESGAPDFWSITKIERIIERYFDGGLTAFALA